MLFRSADRLAALRKAFDEMVVDPKFVADAARRNLELEITSGVEVQKIAADILSASPEIVAKAAKAMD